MKITPLTGPARSITRLGEPVDFAEGLYRLTECSYAYLVPNGSWGETNLGLIDCGGQSVLIDTGWDLSMTRALMHAAASILARAPVERVINTHADGDHCWGNQLFDGRQILSTAACARQLGHLRPVHMRSTHALGRALRHVPVLGLDAMGHYLHQMLDPYDFGSITLTLPTDTFTGSIELCVGGVDIIVREVGPAHTDGDAIVYLPRERVAYAADILFVGVTPVAWSGPIDNITAALRWLLSLDLEHIVPGHGPLATPTDVQRLIDYWDFVQEQVHARFTRGMPLEAAARDVIHSRAFARLGFARWDSPERLLTSCYAMYRSWGADPNRLPGILGALDQQRRQAALAFEFPGATPRRMHRAGPPWSVRRGRGERP